MDNIRRNIHPFVSIVVMLGICATLFHVHNKGNISDTSVESPTSNQISLEHDHCLICAHNTEGIESTQVTDVGEITSFGTIEFLEPANVTSNTFTLFSDRAPPFLA